MIVLKKELKEKKSVLAFFIEVAISQSSPPFIQNRLQIYILFFRLQNQFLLTQYEFIQVLC